MNEGIKFFTPSKAQDMKRVRVFVKGLYNRYGECSERSLNTARKHGTNVKVTFSKYMLGEKRRMVLSCLSTDEYIPVNLIK